MVHDFSLPRDLYFGGQDRVGSIGPLLGQIPYKLFHINHLWSESITHYLLLLLGYFAFSTFLNKKSTKLIFAVIWFLPVSPFLGLTRYSLGLHYSLLAIGLYFITRFEKKAPSGVWPVIREILPVFLAFTAAVWVTETAFVTIAIIIGTALFYHLKQQRKIHLPTAITITVAIICGGIIILLLKNAAVVSDFYEYNKQLLNKPDEILGSLKILGGNIAKGFHPNHANPLLLIYNYLVVVLLIAIPATLFISGSAKKVSWRWALVFLLDGLAFLCINILSHWSYLNGVARRYFVSVYIVVWLANLMMLEAIQYKRPRKILIGLAILTVIIGAGSIPYGYKYVYPKRLTPKAQVVGEFRELGKIGIISEYWNSYGSSFVDPENIKATPHDKCEVRNPALVDSVFMQPNLYLIKDMWLETFPEQIEQFGNTLIKAGEEFNIGDCNVCRYELLPFDTTLTLKDLKFNDKCKISSDSSLLTAFRDSTELEYKHIVYGPYITLPAGHYKACFYAKCEAGDSDKAIAVLDIVADYGQNVLGSIKLTPREMSKTEAGAPLEIPFTTIRPVENVEFRIYYYGNSDLEFSHIEISNPKD